MKLEFLDNIGNDGEFSQIVSEQLIRLYDFDASQAISLKNVIENDLLRAKNPVNLASLDFIEPVNCNLTFWVSDKDEGLVTTGNKNFDCYLTAEAYENMIALIEPFCKTALGFQWLYEVDCPIDLLFSPGGTW